MFDEWGWSTNVICGSLKLAFAHCFSELLAFPSLAGPYGQMVTQKEGRHKEKIDTSSKSQ